MNRDVNSYVVKYQYDFNNGNDIGISRSFLKKIKDFIFGSDNFILLKPSNLLAIDSNNICILDQGLTSIVIADRNQNRFECLNPNEYYLPSLLGIAKFDKNNFLISDSKLNELFIFNNESMTLESFPINTPLMQPTGIAVNPEKEEIVVSETAEHKLSVFNFKGELINTIGKRGTDTLCFNFPTYLVFDSDYNLYVVDAMNFRIQILDSNYHSKKIFGEHGDAAGYFSSIKGISVDRHGHIYVIDTRLHAVQVFDQNGNFLSIFGGQGNAHGEFWMPTGISIDKDDFIYVADTYNSRIQVFKLLEK